MLSWACKAIECNSESLAPFKIGGALGIWFIRLCSSFRPGLSSCLINSTINIPMSDLTPDLSALHSSKWAPVVRPIPDVLAMLVFLVVFDHFFKRCEKPFWSKSYVAPLPFCPVRSCGPLWTCVEQSESVVSLRSSMSVLPSSL
uniref:WD-repeat protein n=1 Tax=Solanum tuberosum TaxID=4113 RepID=M1ACT6_SOLTU